LVYGPLVLCSAALKALRCGSCGVDCPTFVEKQPVKRAR